MVRAKGVAEVSAAAVALAARPRSPVSTAFHASTDVELTLKEPLFNIQAAGARPFSPAPSAPGLVMISDASLPRSSPSVGDEPTQFRRRLAGLGAGVASLPAAGRTVEKNTESQSAAFKR